MEIKLEFKNYKLLKDVSVDLDNSNVYLVAGGNRKGKTSFITAIQSLLEAKQETKQPVTIGEKEGQIVGSIKMADGLTYVVKLDFTDEQSKFTLVYPDGKVSKKVTDIRALFQYNTITAEEFLAWSSTEEGRRKQKTTILSLLPLEIQQKYAKLEQEEKQAFDERTIVNRDIDGGSAILSNMNTGESPYASYIDKVDVLIEQLKELEDQYAEIYKSESINSKIDSMDEDLESIKQVSFNLGLQIDSDINALKTKIATLRKEIPNKDELKARIDKGKAIIKEVETIKYTKQAFDKASNELNQKKIEGTELDNKIAKLREAKNKLIFDAKLPLTDIVIMEDGIYLSNEKGNLPFNDKQVSTSEVMKLVAKIMLLLNKQTPILCLGRAESFDKNSLNELALFAEENNAVIILDKVLEKPEELKIIGYEAK